MRNVAGRSQGGMPPFGYPVSFSISSALSIRKSRIPRALLSERVSILRSPASTHAKRSPHSDVNTIVLTISANDTPIAAAASVLTAAPESHSTSEYVALCASKKCRSRALHARRVISESGGECGIADKRSP